MPSPRLVALFLVALAACGSQVEVPSRSTTGAGGAGGAGGGCAGEGPFCAWGCGSDAFDQPLCVAGNWVCPPGTVDSNTCPSGTCWGPPLPCEVCEDGWACHPDEMCTNSCGGMVCATCVGAPDGTTILGGCACACDAPTGQYSCQLAPGCCNQDIDCGDETYVACAEHVCKQPVALGCWKNEECPAGMLCTGVFVCPCGYDCDAPDVPGVCQNAPPAP